MFHFILRIVVAVAIVLAGCGFLFPKRYVAPKPGEPFATLSLAKPTRPNPIPIEPVQYFDVFDDASCAKGGHGGFLGALTPPVNGVLGKLSNNQSREAYSVVPDRQLFLRARMVQTLDSRRRSLTTNNCTNEHPSGGGEQRAGTAVCERHLPLPSIGHAHQPMSAAGALAAFSAHPVRQSR
ncbi:hypothetical protein [Xanthomonas euvesicatoria]|uniref:hypothetical protein n=1 Tax=Xanthomonas euvesicatoria TaxID=456327 RepID=UPI0031BA7C20